MLDQKVETSNKSTDKEHRQGSVHYSRENMGLVYKLLKYSKKNELEFNELLENFITRNLNIEHAPTVAYVKAKVELSEILLETLSELTEIELNEYRAMPVEWIFEIALSNSKDKDDSVLNKNFDVSGFILKLRDKRALYD